MVMFAMYAKLDQANGKKNRDYVVVVPGKAAQAQSTHEKII